MPLLGGAVVAAVGAAGVVAVALASFGVLLLEELAHGVDPFVFACAGWLGGGAVAVSGTVLLASAGAATRLLLASG